MELPETFRSEEKQPDKIQYWLSNEPKLPDDNLYEAVVYHLIDPEYLENTKVSDDKFSSAQLQLDYKNGLYRINLALLFDQRCETDVEFLDLDGDKKGLKSLIEEFFKHNPKFHSRLPLDENLIEQSKPSSGPEVWYASLKLDIYYLPRGIAYLAKNFLDGKGCPIYKVALKNVTEKELRESGLPEERIILKRTEKDIIFKEDMFKLGEI